MSIILNTLIGKQQEQMEKSVLVGQDLEKELTASEESGRASLDALIGVEAAKTQKEQTEYELQQSRRRQSDESKAKIQKAYSVDQLTQTVAGNMPELIELSNVAGDALTALNKDIDSSKNPIFKLWANSVTKPKLEQKLMERRQQVIDEVSTAATVFGAANNAQTIADSFIMTADTEDMKKARYNLQAAQTSALAAEGQAQLITERAKNFQVRYNLSSDAAKNFGGLLNDVAQIHSLGLHTRSLALQERAANTEENYKRAKIDQMKNGKNGDVLAGLDPLDRITYLKGMVALGEAALDEQTILVLEKAGVNFTEALSLSPVGRGMVRANAIMGTPFVQTEFMKTEQDANLLLAEGLKAIQTLDVPTVAIYGGQVFKAAQQEMQEFIQWQQNPYIVDKDGEKIMRPLPAFQLLKTTPGVAMSVGTKGEPPKFLGYDFRSAMNVKMPLGAAGIPTTVTTLSDFFMSAVTRYPGSALGKHMFATSPQMQELLTTNAPGSKVAKNIQAYADGKTPEGFPALPAGTALNMDHLLLFAGGDSRELAGFYQTAAKAMALQLPVSQLGATPVIPKIYADVTTEKSTFFGVETETFNVEINGVETINQYKASKLIRDAAKKRKEAAKNTPVRYTPNYGFGG